MYTNADTPRSYFGGLDIFGKHLFHFCYWQPKPRKMIVNEKVFAMFVLLYTSGVHAEFVRGTMEKNERGKMGRSLENRFLG